MLRHDDVKRLAASLQPASFLSGDSVQIRWLEHDPEKWVPVFGKDHAPRIS
jgi:hypothetical protein